MDTRQAVVYRILDLCRQRGLTVNALARLSGVPPSTLKNIVNGVSKNPGILTIKQLCDGLDISLPEFLNVDAFHNSEQEIK